jgi:hypothetical protein
MIIYLSFLLPGKKTYVKNNPRKCICCSDVHVFAWRWLEEAMRMSLKKETTCVFVKSNVDKIRQQ